MGDRGVKNKKIYCGALALLLIGGQVSAALPSYPNMPLRPDLRLTDEELDVAVRKVLARVRTYTSVIRTIGQLGVMAGDGIMRAVSGSGLTGDRMWQHNAIGGLVITGSLDASLRAVLNKDPSLVDAVVRGLAWGAAFFKTTERVRYTDNLLMGVLASLLYYGECKAIGQLVKHLGPLDIIGGDFAKAQLERSVLRIMGFLLFYLANASAIFTVGHLKSNTTNSTSRDMADAVGYFFVLPLVYELFIESIGLFVYENVRDVIGSGALQAQTGAGEEI